MKCPHVMRTNIKKQTAVTRQLAVIQHLMPQDAGIGCFVNGLLESDVFLLFGSCSVRCRVRLTSFV
jgi:hypothetical protein